MLEAGRLQRQKMTRRRLLDWVATHFIRVGGMFVVIAVTLIFVYLLYKVFPLFSEISIKSSPADYISQSSSLNDKKYSAPYYHGVDEYTSILYAVGSNGQVSYTDLKGVESFPSESLFPSSMKANFIEAYSLINQLSFDSYAVIAANKKVSQDELVEQQERDLFVVQHRYSVSYPNDVRKVTPQLIYPWGEATLKIDVNVDKMTLREDDDNVVVAVSKGQFIKFYHYAKEQSLLDDEVSFELEDSQELEVNHAIDFLLINFDLRWLIVMSKSGKKTFFPLYEEDIVAHKTEVNHNNTAQITQAAWLIGEISLLIGTDQGEIEQWFPVREQGGEIYRKIRSYKLSDHPISTLNSERQRKGFVAADKQGNAGIFYTSSENHLTTLKVSDNGIVHTVISPQDNNIFFLDSNNQWHRWQVDNPHPEGNFKQIWQKIHYENYSEPQYLWQSSAANQDFEPKFSLTPLLFGTIKGAFYALLFAIPLAILGAIYTAFFMSKRMRQYIKPTIEIMEALPTVILGFLAGLWMAPFVEKHLMFLFLMLFFIPIGILLFGFFSRQLVANSPFSISSRFITIIPLLFVLSLLCYTLASPIEELFFSGDLRQYITQELGITYNQRNALVVGFAMGFAVIPTIFSITEDAIYSVPKHLVNGSLAMGASPWQTLVGVVLPTASPAIFSAVMIGLGRAVGETMIVLMATGNTPVMDFNIFEGMRTLSANIAVEMPESEVDSTHFRVLFLAALVLFMFTFVFNTIAESIRLRLKKKYAEL